MLRKLFVILTSTAVMLSFSAVPSFSGRHYHKKHTYKKHMRHHFKAALPMYQINENGQWTLYRNAPRGLMKYNLWGKTFNFTFNGTKLSPHTSYTLLYYKEGEISDYVQLGEGFTDRYGRIYFENSVDICSMPAEDDALSAYGARILLVPSDAFYGEAGLLFLDPGTSLEGSHLIRYLDTDGCATDDPVDEVPAEDPSDPVDENPVNDFPFVPEGS